MPTRSSDLPVLHPGTVIGIAALLWHAFAPPDTRPLFFLTVAAGLLVIDLTKWQWDSSGLDIWEHIALAMIVIASFTTHLSFWTFTLLFIQTLLLLRFGGKLFFGIQSGATYNSLWIAFLAFSVGQLTTQIAGITR